MDENLNHGIGIDRVCMMLPGQESIYGAIWFPQLKSKQDQAFGIPQNAGLNRHIRGATKGQIH